MRVLVTGAGGYLGSVIAHALHAQQHDVSGVIHRPSDVSRPFAIHVASLDNAADVGAFSASIPRCDAIVHAAASLIMRPDDPSVSASNAVGTHQMLLLARRWKCSHFVYLSSASLIGPPRDVPATECHPVCPPTVYHASKYYGELLVTHNCADGIAGVSLRVTAPVGAHMPRNRMMRVFVERAMRGEALTLYGQGTRRQDYVDERDVAQAVLCALQRGARGVFNVGGGASYSNAEVARLCIECLGSSSEVRFASNPDPEEGIRWEYSISAAQEKLGYHPHHDVRDSIRSIAQRIADQN